jgi:hypothetical protein
MWRKDEGCVRHSKSIRQRHSLLESCRHKCRAHRSSTTGFYGFVWTATQLACIAQSARRPLLMSTMDDGNPHRESVSTKGHYST